MITKFFSAVTIRTPATGAGAKLGRIFLASIPPRRRGEIMLDHKLLGPGDTAAPEIRVKFKDGTTISINPAEKKTVDMVEEFDRQSRSLQVQESLKE